MKLVSPFNRTLRELREMKYPRDNAVRLDVGTLAGSLGAEPRTLPIEAVQATLKAPGVLPAEARRQATAAPN